MTMDAHQIVPAAPLDLRTRTRQRGGVEERTQKENNYKGNSRVTTEVSVESQTSLRTATVNNQRYRTSSADLQEYYTGSQVVKRETDMGNPAFFEHLEHSPMAQSPSTLSSQSPICAVLSGGTGAALKENSERSSSNLPLRKRPFPTVRDIPLSPPSGEDNLSPEKKTELYRRISQQKVPKRDDHEGRACGPLMPPRSASADGGYEKIETQSNGYHAYPFCPYPVFVFAPMPPLHTQQLLEYAALATRPDEDGDTALHIAVVKEEEALVYRLIHLLTLANKDLDTYNNLRQTPLHLAVITHQAMLVEALLRGGADSGALDRNGQTAFHLCCEHAQRACLTVLLSQPAPSPDLEIKNFEGLTPLHLAVQGGHMEMVTLLLEAGASINSMDNKSGQTPLMHAVEGNNGDMVQFLIERGCDVNRQSYSGNTALHEACGRGQVNTVRLLLKKGADSSLKNYHNDTPVMVAKNKRVTDVLRGKGSKHPKTKEENSESASPQRNTSYRVNVSSSPKSSLRRSGSTTSLPFHHRAIKSPRAPTTSSPHSQSTDSLSGPHSPIDTQVREPHPVKLGSNSMAGDDRLPRGRAYPLPRHLPSLQHSPMADSMTLLPACYPPVGQSHFYPESSFILLPPGFCPTSQMTTGESRPLSRCSDQ